MGAEVEMAEIVVRNWDNQTVLTLKLDDGVFGYPYKEHHIHEAMCAFRAAGRRGTHKTKNRSEVSGGTRKLWKQKHTGRARMGDTRSPLWRHGGTVFGPQPRDYAWHFPRQMRRNAIKSALAQKLREGRLVCLESLDLPSPKTRELETRVTSGLGVSGKALLLPEETLRNLELAARNNPRLTVARALGASIVDLLAHETVIASEGALLRLAEVLAR
jgi:large subunit ribosomal protein L4